MFTLSSIPSYFEHLWFSCAVSGINIATGVLYRPTSPEISYFLESAKDVLPHIVFRYDEMFCLGDTNIDFLSSSALVLRFKSILHGPD